MEFASDQARQSYIDSLCRESEHYLLTGNKERAQQVSAELTRLGAEAKTKAKRAEKRPAKTETTER